MSDNPPSIYEMRDMLSEAASLFREYESHHRAKANEAGRPEKAVRNAEIAERMEQMVNAVDASVGLKSFVHRGVLVEYAEEIARNLEALYAIDFKKQAIAIIDALVTVDHQSGQHLILTVSRDPLLCSRSVTFMWTLE